MKPELIPFESEHAWRIRNREGETAADIERGLEWLKRYPHLCFSGTIGGEIIGAAGIVFIAPGVGYPVALFSEAITRHKLWLQKTIKIYLAAIIRTFELKNLEVEILESSLRNRRWIESLGFNIGAPVERYPDSRGRSYLRFRLSLEDDRCPGLQQRPL